MTRQRRGKSPPPRATARPPLRPAPRRKAQPAAPPTEGRAEGGAEGGLRELRASIGNLRAAAEALATLAIPRPEGSARASRPAALLQAVLEEAERASRGVDRLAQVLDARGAPSTPESIDPASQFTAEIAARAADELDLTVRIAGAIADELRVPHLFVDPVLGALGRLRRDFSVGEVEFSARRHADLLALEIAFQAREPEASRLREEHHAVLAGGTRGEAALGAAARAAGGEAWLAIRRGESTFSLRILLPMPTAA